MPIGTAVKKAGDDGDKVRRALANIPVLTICDDHEVTDDWFITGAWRARVLGSTLGRSMIRNALLAYVLFQAWGNTPDAFATPGTPEAQLLALVPTLFPGTGAAPDPGVAPQIDHLLGLGRPDRHRRRAAGGFPLPPRHRGRAAGRIGHQDPPRIRHAQRAAGPAHRRRARRPAADLAYR